ncbi:ParB/RepB/Spo0J family partition protein [Pedobacter frigiditerrae]|uniref:ParB/RepB/Spo0J family partition protein n=1 Tax=Pedobacter frigiditerrae TaxID=2530452 RepID=UPI00292F1889|nr:ParB/RepB/Spo0J family partition protein [Pedobacter frigiditerrae]
MIVYKTNLSKNIYVCAKQLIMQIKSTTIEFIATSDLHFDPENPRLPRTVKGDDEEAVINWMLENENVTELMASIAEKGFFAAEPLLVQESSLKGQYIVIEGNRRLTAVKLLLKPELAKIRKSTIEEIISEGKHVNTLSELPVIKFESSEDIQLYLGYRHITGVQPWDSLAKARYLKKLKGTLNEPDEQKVLKSLAKIIGSRTDHVKLLLTGLDVYNRIENDGFYGIEGLNEKTVKFGVLYTAINNSNIADFIGLDFDKPDSLSEIKQDNLAEVTKWMFEKNSSGFTRLGESRNLRLLNKVVENDKALEAFRKEKSLQDAVLLTDEPLEIFRISINDALSKIQTARDYVHLVDDKNSSYEDVLLEIRQISKSVSSSLKARFLEDDED